MIAVVISQYLGATGKGEQGIIITTIAFILIISNIVSGSSLVYLSPRHPVTSLLIPSYLWSLIISGFAWLFLYYVQVIPAAYTTHVAILAGINSFAAVNCSVLIGKENIRANNIVTFLQVIITIAVLLIMMPLLKHFDIGAYLYALYAAYIFSFFAGLFFLAPYIRKEKTAILFSKKVITALFRYGFINQLSHIAQMFSLRFSYYFLDYFSGEKAVGIYSNGVSIVESIWMIGNSIALVQYSRISNSDDLKYNQNLTVTLLRINLIISFFCLLPLLILPSGFYIALFGKEFYDINRIIWALSPGILIYTTAFALGHYFSGTGKYHINTLASVLGLIATVVLSFALIPRYSYMGSAIAATISYTLTSIFLIVVFSKQSGISPLKLLPAPSHIREYIQYLKTKFHGKPKS